MTNEKKLRLLHSLYERIPETPCLGVCGDICCKTPFHVSKFEQEIIGYDFNDIGPCKFLENGRCGIYETRPFICRKFNASPWLGCEKIREKRPMSNEDATRLYMDYYMLFWHVDDLRAWTARQREVMRELAICI